MTSPSPVGSPFLSDTALKPQYVRNRSNIHKEVQTEASFVPSMVELKYAYEPDASEQFTQLSQLRKLIEKCMQEVVGGVYDVVSFKDILFKMEEELPTNLPVTDMLLLSSKLFRTTSELGRLVACFFAVVFADEYSDEHFHFSEIRILQRELKHAKEQLKEATEEKLRLQQILDNVGQVALDHGKAVELLENHNQALQLQTTALEDQMALLFRQLNSDLEVNCKEAYDKVTQEMEIQERLNPSRTTFRQTMDNLGQQIRSSRTIISEVREALMACNQGPRTGEAYLAIEPSVRFKLKMLDSNFQQLVGRFTAVKDTVVETAQELMTALHERKRILYLSYQHIRLYDLQNAKLRAGKAVLSELRSYTTGLLQRMQATFPSGAITSVDRIGRITTQRWHGGYTLAALRQRKAAAAAVAAGQARSSNPPPGADTEAVLGGSTAVLPGLSEAEVMAAESELAAFEAQNDFGGNSSAGAPSGRAMSARSGRGSLVNPAVPSPPPQAGAPGTAFMEYAEAASSSTGLKRGSVAPEPPADAPGRRRSSFAPPTPAGVLMEEANTKDIPPFTNVYGLLELVRHIDGNITHLNDVLTLEDEMSAFLKTLTLSVTTTARSDIGGDGSLFPPPSGAAALEKMEGDFERTLMPTGGLTTYRQRNSIDSLIERERERAGEGEDDTDSNSSKEGGSGKRGRRRSSSSNSKNDNSSGEGHTVSRSEQAHAEALLARQAQQLQRKQEQLSKLQDDFSSKLGFLRQVYEARITDLEIRETTVKKKFTGGPSAGNGGGDQGGDAAAGSGGGDGSGDGGDGGGRAGPSGESGVSTPRSIHSAGMGNAGKRKPRAVSPGTQEREFAMVREMNVAKGTDDEMNQRGNKTDREELLAARSEWRKSKPALLSSRKMREATSAEVDRIEQKTEVKKAKMRRNPDGRN